MNSTKSDLEEFKVLLSRVYKKGNNGATFEELMNLLELELSKISVKEHVNK